MTDKGLIAEAHIVYANWKLGPGETRDMIERLVNALAAHQWQDISTAPRDGASFEIKRTVLVVGNGLMSDQFQPPTGWRPLPTPPETKP